MLATDSVLNFAVADRRTCRIVNHANPFSHLVTDPIREQYEGYPYPPRDPRDEAKRLITGSPSYLYELDHYVFGGRLDLARPFRALFAGAGTGDGLIMLAQQLADVGSPAELVHLDLSTASRRIAEARAAARGLSNIQFVTGSLLDLDPSAIGTFDYIDCCGVLHHLERPEAGLAALTRVLQPTGGMGIMVYGELGRTGVYHMQVMLRMIGADRSASERIALARRLIAQLPETNWFRRNRQLSDHVETGEAGVYDLLLHSSDRPYRVADVEALIATAGLRLVTFIEPCRYDPASYINDPALAKAVAALEGTERRGFAELLAGNLKTHVFYVVRADNPIGPPDPADLEAIPILWKVERDVLARGLQKDLRVRAGGEGITLGFAVPRLSPAIIRAIDGRRTLAEIHRQVAATTGLDWPAFSAVFQELYKPLNGFNLLLLRFRSENR